MILKIQAQALFLFCILGFCYQLPLNPYHIIASSIVCDNYTCSMDLDYLPDNSSQKSSSSNSPTIEKAKAFFESIDKSILHFKLTDREKPRWEVPPYHLNSGEDMKKQKIDNMGLMIAGDPFGFSLYDFEAKKNFVSTIDYYNNTINFTDKYIEFGLWFPAKRIFGLGERVTPDFELCEGATDCIYTTFTKDDQSPIDKGEYPGAKNIYGHHPFYMLQLKSGKFIGVLFYNSNYQDTIIKKTKKGINVFHKTVGGIPEFYFMYPASSPDEMLMKYHALIGRPYLPPMWTLGFHQCRWGWKNLSVVKGVVARFEQNDIPLDVIWSDIDYMYEKNDFTINNNTYKGMGEFVETIHKKSMYWVPIIDAGLGYNKSDPLIDESLNKSALIKSAKTKKEFVGRVWPGDAVYLDWFNNNSFDIWSKGHKRLRKLARFDGIWLDMNEASNFCNGECNSDTEITSDTDTFGNSRSSDPHDPKEFDDLPYMPGNFSIKFKSIEPAAYHFANNDYEDTFYKEYNLHSLWGLHECNATYRYFLEGLNKRPFIMTRASFVGSGMYTTKWLGDNYSRWEYMRYSIIGIYTSQLFGIPMNGADICGFIGDTNEELCKRWMQLGAFYPFSRNHNAEGALDQEPYKWPSVAEAGRNAIRQKYSIIRYYYGELFKISQKGGSLFRPLFFDNVNDEQAYNKKNETFLIGKSLMVAPILFPKTTEVHPYCTNENWYNLFTRKPVMKYNDSVKIGKVIDLKAGDEYVNVLLRGGSIIPFQNALQMKVRRMKTLDVLPMEIIVLPNGKGDAKGDLIISDQNSITPMSPNDYLKLSLTFSYNDKKLIIIREGSYTPTDNYLRFTRFTIFGAETYQYEKMSITDNNGKSYLISGTRSSDKSIISFYERIGVYWYDIKSVEFS